MVQIGDTWKQWQSCFYRKILEDSSKVLNKNGSIVFEIGYDQGEKIKLLAADILKNYTIEVRKDISNNDRIVIIEFNEDK